MCDEECSLSIDDVPSSISSEQTALDLDSLQGNDDVIDTALRGWSMRRGHMKKVMKPKMGKAAILADTRGQGKEVSKGRNVFARSVNSHRWDWDRDWDRDSERAKARKRRAWRHDIPFDTSCDEFGCAEEPCYWHERASDECDEEEWEWAPIDSYVIVEAQVEPPSRLRSMGMEKVTDIDRLAWSLRPYGAILDKERFKELRSGFSAGFVELQKIVLGQDGPSFCKELSKSQSRLMHVRPAPVSEDVQRRFLDARACLKGKLRAGYHGTNISSLPSIYKNGLLIPGQSNDVRVANGSAHGLGIYTAKVCNPRLSWSFCRAPTEMEKKIVVCGVLDDASTHSIQNYKMGNQTVSHESQNVRHAGDAMVIFDHRRVAPLFEVSIGDAPENKSAAPDFDWSKWYLKVSQVYDLYPTWDTQVARRPLMRCQERQRTPMAYLQRRGARKRSLKGI